MSSRSGVAGLAVAILIACVCAGLIAWRLTPPRPHPSAPPTPAATSPVAVNPELPIRLSTIIDLPGDPVLVQRGAVLAPKDALISVPAKLGQPAPQTPAKAFFVNSTLISTTGGYMGKFQEAGQEAEALAAQLAMNSAQIAAAQNEPDAGSDDDGGADTPADAQSQFLTTANSNELEINLGGSRGRPQLKETILKPLVADTISNLLIANGYDADSARMIESAAKDSPAHIQTLPPQSVALAVGALDLAGAYRIKQIAIFENGEYVITIAAKDDGGYEQAAEPIIPAQLIDNSLKGPIATTHFTIADGVYSAGIRNGMPEPVIRETIQLISRLADLRSPLQADQTLRVLFEPEFRDKAKAGGKVVYVGLHGNALAIDCYVFEGSDGAFRCFDPKAGAEAQGGESNSPSSLGNSGATSVGGDSCPHQGARRSPPCSGSAFTPSFTSFGCMPASTSAQRSVRSFAPQRMARSRSPGPSPASAIISASSTRASRPPIPTSPRSPRRSTPASRSSRATSSRSPATPAFRPAPTCTSSST